MGSRNHIVTKLMEMLPRRNREGVTPNVDLGGPVILFALKEVRLVSAFLHNHSVFGHVSARICGDAIDCMIDSTKQIVLDGELVWLFKLRVYRHAPSGNSFWSPLAKLAVMHAECHAIVENGVVLIPNGNAPLSAQQELAQHADDVPLLVCNMPGSITSDTFDESIHQITILR